MSGAIFLRVDGGSSKVQNVLSQDDINKAAEGNLRFFMMEGDKVYQLRTGSSPGVDPRTPQTFVIDAWIPVQAVPEELQEKLRKANEEDAQVQGKDAEQLKRARAEGRMEIPAASEQSIAQRDMRDPNWRNSNEAKELADRMKVGNLSKDVRGLPHDGVPGPTSAENSQTPGVANEPQNAQVKEEVDRATGKQPTPEVSEQAKPAAPSPGSQRPAVPGPRSTQGGAK